jgi:glutamate synthase (NADPH/NADH) large chain/glutamate synthase (ferredoxin)
MNAAHARRSREGRGGVVPDPWLERDACGVGLVARASGVAGHDVLRLALTAVSRLAHRGAASSDHSGDGAGVLTQLPRRLLTAEGDRLGLALHGRQYAVGSLFLPPQEAALARAVTVVAETLRAEGLPLLGWRPVPVAPHVLAPSARAARPAVWHVFVGAPAGVRDDDAWERSLYVARRAIERRAAEEGFDPFFVCSLSCRTIVYKALLTGPQLAEFFPDLRRPEYETAVALFHQRYSTNTAPSWPLAQPFRLLAHNGEINTLWGNRNAMEAREPLLASNLWGGAVERLTPIVWRDGSDSASLDNALELLVRSGRDPVHALMMLVPQADTGDDAALRGFYEFHDCLMESWDGPAAIAASDGQIALAAVDRNGLRPCRYKVTRDGLLVAASEVGVVDLPSEEVVESGRLGPGELIAADLRRGAILHSAAAKHEVASRRPYGKWVSQSVVPLPKEPAAVLAGGPPMPADLRPSHLTYGWTFEDLRFVLEPMTETGQDAVWSMGDDTPVPPLTRFPQSLYVYFRQRFAQVTNPAIDSLRETLVMSLRMHLGRRGSLLTDRPAGLRLVRLEHPVLREADLAALCNVAGVQAVRLDAVWPVATGTDGLREALLTLCRSAGRAVHKGARILVLSDRAVDAAHAPIPMLLAVGAVHHHLRSNRQRPRLGLVVETGDAWDVHHLAALIGYGAEAVHPWLALAAARASGGEAAIEHYRSAAAKGLRKILAKMGISTLASYCGAQIFEALGVGAEVIDQCFPGTASMIGGIGFTEIAEDVLARHRTAYPAAADVLPDHGRVRYRRDGEAHGWAPGLVKALYQSATSGERRSYDSFVNAVQEQGAMNLRDLLQVRAGSPIALDDVEPMEGIRRRFISTAMSLGALSPEAHETLAIAMNRMGARSNSGEGGEDPLTFAPRLNGDRADNRIKQVASGRFGVTTEYLIRADELEIKIAQGSKPGEGGQLPGHKVTELIARLRHAVPGSQLISPPPHHDIYSIEDLAQLIHDLKQVNRHARVGVKLVAEAGVGRVAAGVAKAFADYVLISGCDGGTGASPLSSIKHAGSPWELGLAETHAILIENGLRDRIEVRTDGGLRTGRDVIMAALLGAETYGFGSAALVAIGCAMARQCHLNTCPTGIATQRPDLRKKFKGTPEQVVAYFTHVAEEVRRLLAHMGFKTMDDIIGRADLLERVDRPEAPRAQMLDLSMLLQPPFPGRRHSAAGRIERPGVQSLEEAILGELDDSLNADRRFLWCGNIGNHHLSVGARIAGRIAERVGNAGLPAGTVRLRFRGSAGQSFGAFALPGMHLELDGEANDYVGKGLCGGEITIRPRPGVAARHPVLAGNTVLYGATAGRLFIAGRAGDRFAVRNSGATAVVEGTGDHCCEYMTRGTVVVLGPVGRNFGAGMSNGAAYVLDDDDSLSSLCNPDMVAVTDLEESDETVLRQLLSEHAGLTGSPKARAILEDWPAQRARFRKVAPPAPPAPPQSPAAEAAPAASDAPEEASDQGAVAQP